MNWNNDPHGAAPALGTETLYPSLDGRNAVPPSAVRNTATQVKVPPPVPAVPPVVRFDELLAQDFKDKVDGVPKLEGDLHQFAPNVADLNLLEEIKRATQIASPSGGNVSRDELAHILEGFACVLRANEKYGSVSYTEHITQVTQLKEMLMEAQETIINLLNDRVFDRAKLARLEAEVNLLPDLQSQAHRAMGIAAQSEQVAKELEVVRAELDRLRTSYMRAEERARESWLSRLFNRK